MDIYHLVISSHTILTIEVEEIKTLSDKFMVFKLSRDIYRNILYLYLYLNL